MKRYNAHKSSKKSGKANTVSKERRQRSLIKPFLYYSLELLLIMIVLGTFEYTMDPREWSKESYFVAALWLAYITKKLIRVLARQK